MDDNQNIENQAVESISFTLASGEVIMRTIPTYIAKQSIVIDNILMDCEDDGTIPISHDVFIYERQIDIFINVWKFLVTEDGKIFKEQMKRPNLDHTYTHNIIDNLIEECDKDDIQVFILMSNFLDIEVLLTYFSIQCAKHIAESFK